MPQAFLGSNPGTNIKDALEPELNDSTAETASDTGAWTEVNFPGEVVAVVDVGAVTGTSVTVDIEVEGADDDSGTNAVSLGKFDTITDASDDEVRILALRGWKRFMRADIVVAGTSPSAVVPVVLRPKDYLQGDGATA